jgi:periplasmic protein TonB
MKAGFNKHRYRNFFIGISISSALMLCAFNYKVAYNVGEIVEVKPTIPEGVKVMYVHFPPPPEPKKKQQTRSQKTKPFTVDAKLKIVKNNITLPKSVAPPKPITISPPTIPVTGEVTPTKIHDWVDEPPVFPGGPEALNTFLRHNIEYPGDCMRDEQEGIVRVLFVVNENGEITDLKILKNDLFESAGIESQRVISMMPRWKPGIKDGKKVKTYFIQPIRFTLF